MITGIDEKQRERKWATDVVMGRRYGVNTAGAASGRAGADGAFEMLVLE